MIPLHEGRKLKSTELVSLEEVEERESNSCCSELSCCMLKSEKRSSSSAVADVDYPLLLPSLAAAIYEERLLPSLTMLVYIASQNQSIRGLRYY